MPIPRGGPHWGIDFKFDLFSEFEFIFETAVGYGSGIGGRVLMKKTRGKISRVRVPLVNMKKHERKEEMSSS
jgi:hypothetical protein